MTRGDLWLAEVGGKRRPVVVMTRAEVIDVRRLVTVAEVTTSMRHIPVEVGFDHAVAGLTEPSVINCDGLHTVPQSMLVRKVGELDTDTLEQVCSAVSYAIGC